MTTLMTPIIYGPFFSATYSKGLDVNLRPYVVHHPYRLIDNVMTLSSWDAIEPIIEKDGRCDCWCRINLDKVVSDTVFFDDVAPIPIPVIAIDEEYLNELQGKVQALNDIAQSVASAELTTEEARAEAEAIANTLITVAEPRIL